MKKCVKIILSDVRDPQALYDALRNGTSMNDIEGVVEVVTPDIIEITVSGIKDVVDKFVNEVEDVIIAYNLHFTQHIKFIVEPFYKNEDYRGVVRFLRKGTPHRA